MNTILNSIYVAKNALLHSLRTATFCWVAVGLVIAVLIVRSVTKSKNTPMETVCRIVCMLCVGFLEEVIFRGLLFTAIAKDNVKSAINTLSTFANDANLTTETHLLHPGILIVITVAYTLILTRTLPKKLTDRRLQK